MTVYFQTKDGAETVLCEGFRRGEGGYMLAGLHRLLLDAPHGLAGAENGAGPT